MTKKKYSEANFEAALDKIKKKEMSYRDAKMEYGVPIATLCYHNNGKHNSHKVEQKTILSFEEEKLLVSSIVTLGDVGVGVNKFEIRRIVQNYLKITNQSSVFKDGIPGKKWLKLFLNGWNANWRKIVEKHNKGTQN
jgi:hypothetical protein